MALQDIVKKGSTDSSVPIYAFDNTTGLPKVDLAYNSSGIDLWYRREGAAVTSVTEATLAALTTAQSDGGFLAVSNGEYRLDLPDAAFATGANYVDYGGTATGFTLVGGRVKLVGVDLEDAVRGGMTALPNAAADAAGGLPISDAGGLDLDAIKTDTAAILVDTGTTLDARIPAALVGGRMDATVDATGMESGATAAIRDALLLRTTASGVVGSGSTTANLVASSVAVGATTSLSADAFKGRVIIFNSDTTTAALRGQAAAIVSHTSGSTPTFTLATGAWTTAPLTTDTFTVV